MKSPKDPLASLVVEALDRDLFAGAVVRVRRRGRTLYSGAWGYALKDGPERVPMRESMLFDLASLSKLFTATAALRLVAAGRLSLDSPASEVLGYCGGNERDLERELGGIDVAALLTHSSGLHYWYPFYVRREESFESILASVLGDHPPAHSTIYSDLNFMLLGKIVERVYGAPLRIAVQELVFRPLGLPAAAYGPSGHPGDCAATEFGNRIERGMVEALSLSFGAWRDESRPIRGQCDDGNCHYYFGGAAGHAGIFCDADDLAALGEAYLDGGGAFLPAGLAEEALRDRGAGRGLGFQTGELYPRGGAGHTGFTGTYLHVNPGEDMVIAVLTNRLHVSNPGNLNPFRQAIAAAALELF